MAHRSHSVGHPIPRDETHVWGFRLEIVIAVLLGLAAIVGAFAAMDERLKKMVTWWTSDGNTKKYHSPFVEQDPYYVIPEFAKGAGLDKQTQELFKEGKDAEHRSNRYTLVEVLIASALFLYGIASVTRGYPIKLGFLALGLTLFLLSVAQLARVRWG